MKDLIKSIQDFPKKGVIFRDITPILQNPEKFKKAIDLLSDAVYNYFGEPTLVASPESRGFILGSAVANNLKVGFVPIRKANKLPRDTIKIKFSLEYDNDCLEIHKDAITPQDKVIIIDDVLATGGTAQSCATLIRQLEGSLLGCLFLIELRYLKGCNKLDTKTYSLIKYQ